MSEIQIEGGIPSSFVQKWQYLVDLIAKLADVPAALIMRVHSDTIEVFRTSNSQNNPYEANETAEYGKSCGLYCEHVIRTGKKLCVPNALEDEAWSNNPDVPLGMISYLGLPLLYPDGRPFGTLCVLDSKPNSFEGLIVESLEQFKELIESQLSLISSNMELERELKTVGDVQSSLLPEKWPDMQGLKIATFYEPSRYAGGDYYDVIELPDDRFGILIADVSGHGTHAAVLMTMTYAILHDYPAVADDPARVLNYLNDKLRPVCHGKFVTALYVVYDPAQSTIRYFSAGHMPPIIYRPTRNEFVQLEEAANFPLGLFAWNLTKNGEQRLEPGDVIALYTDGIDERMNPQRNLFGLERLCGQIQENCHAEPSQIVEAIVSENDRFADGLAAPDDRALLIGVVEQASQE